MTESFAPAGTPRREQFPSGSGPRPKSTTLDVTKPRPEAPSTRAEGIRAQRRRRTDTGGLQGLKLDVPKELLDPAYEYRWFIDEPGRVHSKTKMDDWDLVDITSMNGGTDDGRQAEGGTRVARFAEKTATGPSAQPRKMFLARKLKELYQDDKGKEQKALKEREDAMKRSPAPVPGGLSGPTAYIPNRIDDRYSDGSGENRIDKG